MSQPFKRVKGEPQVICKCGMLFSPCSCGIRAYCYSCNKCFNCNHKRGDHTTFRVSPNKPVRYERSLKVELVVQKGIISASKNVSILGKGGRIVRYKGLRRKQDINV